MGVIWTSKTRTRQPISSPSVTRSNPMHRGLRALFDLQTGRELVSGARPTNVVPTLAATQTGLGSKFDGSRYYTYTSQPNLVLLGDISIAAYLDIDAFAGYSAIIAKQMSPVQHVPYEMRLGGDSGASSNVQLLRGPSAGYYALNGVGSMVAGERKLVGASHSPAGSLFRTYRDGERYEASPGVLSAPTDVGSDVYVGGRIDGSTHLSATMFYIALYDRVLSWADWDYLKSHPWSGYLEQRSPVFYSLGGVESTITGVGSTTGTGTASGVGASTAAAVGSSTGTGTASGAGSSSSAGSGVGSTGGTGSATGVGASTAASVGSTSGVGTATGIGAATAAAVGSTSGTGTATGVGANGTVTISAVGSASGFSVVLGVSPSHGGGTGKGQNLSRKQKKKLKAVESQEWLKAEETARQLLNDRFTKQTPQEKAEALQTYVESLQPVIEALKALTVSEVEEAEDPIIELTPHQEILTRFDTLEKKLKSVEELVIILMADL